MARLTKYFTASVGRDKGERFLITEMSAADGEEWALRVLFLLQHSNVDLPEGIDLKSSAGMATLATIGIDVVQKIDFDAIKPLLDQMFECVQYVPAGAPDAVQALFKGDNCQIQEIATRLQLRKEVLLLHVSFFDAVKSQTSAQAPGISTG